MLSYILNTGCPSANPPRSFPGMLNSSALLKGPANRYPCDRSLQSDENELLHSPLNACARDRVPLTRYHYGGSSFPRTAITESEVWNRRLVILIADVVIDPNLRLSQADNPRIGMRLEFRPNLFIPLSRD